MNTPIRDWSRLRVWVVGASTGIGCALAAELLRSGARVALSARTPESLEAVAGTSPGNALVLPVDVTDAAGVRAAFRTCLDRWQGLDVVFHVAGTYEPMRAVDFDAQRLARHLDVNVMGVARVLDHVLPHFTQHRSGHVVIVASVAGYRGLPKALAYGPTKAALINLAEGLYLDLAPTGIGVHLVNPGFVRTPLTAGNDFEMPALIEPEEAARATLRGLARGEFEIHYPTRFTRWLKLLRVLPYSWYFPIVHRITGL
ncbi:MAG: SDR family NAD(P)-dependent oxidoreductase [Betaproteobacteria bacterium]|nr:SDR family NAD(P)-dependent oxidoreductase [Betaproteobacteria bacterium]